MQMLPARATRAAWVEGATQRDLSRPLGDVKEPRPLAAAELGQHLAERPDSRPLGVRSGETDREVEADEGAPARRLGRKA
jgi:hypothetical protein